MKYFWPTIFSVLVSCGGAVDEPAPEQPVEKTNAYATEDAPVDEPAPEYSDALLKQVIEKWQNAYTSADFSAYEDFYGTRFEGVMDTADGNTRFMRDGWLAYKKQQFANAIPQRIENMDIQTGPGVARAFFTQTLSPDTPEQARWNVTLDLFYEDGALKIFREALLLPQKQRMTRGDLPDDIGRFFFVLDNRYVVFDNIAEDLDEKGALYVDDSTALKPVLKDADVLSRRYKWALKKKIIIGYADGRTEIVRLTGVRAIAKFGVHSKTSEYWDRFGVDEIARGEQLWRLARRSDSVYLVGVLDKRRRSKILWAQVYNGNMPYLYKIYPTPKSVERTAVSRLDNTRQWAKVQTRYADETGNSGPWLEHEGKDVVFRAFRSTRNKRRKFAAIVARSGIGCGAFFGAMSGFYSLEKREPVFIGGINRYFLDGFVDDHMAYLAIDMDRDSFPEFIGDKKIYFRKNERWKVYELTIPNINNPC